MLNAVNLVFVTMNRVHGDAALGGQIFALFIIAVAAAWLTARGLSRQRDAETWQSASRALGVATAMQGVHFFEEWFTGFHVEFPALLGLAPMPLSFFVSFNVAWIVVWLASIRPIRKGQVAAFFPAWFLALAGILNGIAHPAMAIVTGGYFPGLLTSPFIGIAALQLARQLASAQSSRLGQSIQK